MSSTLLLKKDKKEKRELVNMILDRFLPRKDDYPKEIHKAMRYTLFAGGKRLRPYLTLLTYNLFRKKITDDVVKAASAIELMHTYTLIHDDLPEIDNDDLRRGKKTCHVMFGSDIALLAGDALLIEAFNFISSITTVSPETKIKMIQDMAVLCGERGLIAGQMQDIISEGKAVSRKTLEFIHLNKTAKLIQLCTRFGTYMAETTFSNLQKMDEFGKILGITFQIQDDILDVEGEEKELGKHVGRDQTEKKATYPALFGLEKSKIIAEKYTDVALKILDDYGDRADLLKQLTRELLVRKS